MPKPLPNGWRQKEEKANWVVRKEKPQRTNEKRRQDFSGYVDSQVKSLVESLNQGERVDKRTLASIFERKVLEILATCSTQEIEQTHIADKARIIDTFFKNLRLLDGEATHIIDHSHVKEISEELPKVIAEMRRRGMDIDGSEIQEAERVE